MKVRKRLWRVGENKKEFVSLTINSKNRQNFLFNPFQMVNFGPRRDTGKKRGGRDSGDSGDSEFSEVSKVSFVNLVSLDSSPASLLFL